MPARSARLFVAVPLPDEVKQQIGRLQRQIRDAGLFRGSFGRKENLHITLKFLGDVRAEAVKEVKDQLALIRFAPFELDLDELGTFGGRKPRVLWQGLRGPELAILHGRVEEALADLVETDQKRYHPHVTVARIKSGPTVQRLTDALDGFERPKGSLTVDEFALFQSVLHADGAKHTIVKVVKAEEQP